MTRDEAMQVELPRRMRKLPKDKRGYPVPVIVLRDKNKTPHFTINDHRLSSKVANKKLCSICGDPLKKDIWFIGGQVCFTHPNGAFLDPPVHHDCGEYALRVCPYLGAPNYAGLVDGRTLKDAATPDGLALIRGETIADTRPELFMMGKCERFRINVTGIGQFNMIKIGPWLEVEAWRHGVRVPDEEVNDLVTMDSKRHAGLQLYGGFDT